MSDEPQTMIQKILALFSALTFLFSGGSTAVAASIALPTALVHNFYGFDQKGPFYNLDVYVKWEVEPNTTTGTFAGYFLTFQNGGGGYFGTQIDSTSKKAIFSIWDIDGTSITALPLGNCIRFGHEGSGSSCVIPYNWIVGREYRLRIWVLDSVVGAVKWGAWIQDTVTGLETPIGTISLKDSKGYSGYGMLSPNGTNFLEQYGSGSVNSCASLPYSKVTWRGPYADSNSYSASTATSSFQSPDCFNSTIYAGTAPLLTMETGGSTVRTVPTAKSLWGVGDKQAPSVPVGLSASGRDSSQIDVAWTAASDNLGVTSYKVYRGGVLQTTLGNVTTFRDANLAASTTYTYTVAACDAAGNCSNQSAAASAATQAIAATTTTHTQSDCLFEWAALRYPASFAPRGTQSLNIGAYYVRAYPQTASYLAVSADRLYYLGPLSENTLLDLGAAITWYLQSGCNK